jgi:transcriptional regulator with PAS, ATPase and Fis domain
VIAATNRRLAAMVEEGRFRLDLYQRLNVIVLEIPPLRERPEDIPALVQFFLKKYAGYYHGAITSVDERFHEELARRTLAGNVRELENLIRQVLAFKRGGDRLDLSDLAAVETPSMPAAGLRCELQPQELVEEGRRMLAAGRVSLADFMDEVERRLLADAMKSSTGTNVDLARRLGLSRRTFYNKLRKHRL